MAYGGRQHAARRSAALRPGRSSAAERERQGLARADCRATPAHERLAGGGAGTPDNQRLPRGTFLRGFTRNYARRSASIPSPSSACSRRMRRARGCRRSSFPPRTFRFVRWATARQSLREGRGNRRRPRRAGFFAAMFWWLFVRPNGAATTAATGGQEARHRGAPACPPRPPEAPVAEASTTPGEQPVAQPPTPVPARLSVAAPDFAASAPAPAPAPPSRRAPPPRGGRLRLAFRGAAWVEITDARGKVLLSRTHAGGSNAEVVGKPPFNLVIGNAPEVRLPYNGPRGRPRAAHARGRRPASPCRSESQDPRMSPVPRRPTRQVPNRRGNRSAGCADPRPVDDQHRHRGREIDRRAGRGPRARGQRGRAHHREHARSRAPGAGHPQPARSHGRERAAHRRLPTSTATSSSRRCRSARPFSTSTASTPATWATAPGATTSSRR